MTRIWTVAIGALLGLLAIIVVQPSSAEEATPESFGLVGPSTGIWPLYDSSRQITEFYFGNRGDEGAGTADASWRLGQSDWRSVTEYAGTFESPESSQPTAPIRAAFMYPWFPKAWDQGGIDPFTWYSPSLGAYDSSDPDLIDRQVELASSIGLEAFIASWWGPGHHTDSAIQAILNRIPQSPNPDFRLAVYYEEEGQSNPSSGEIATDLAYMQKLFDSSAYLRVDGRPVVFVWSSGDNGPDVAKRWADAKRKFGDDVYVVLKVFSGFRDVQNQPDSWHQYGPAAPYHEHLPFSATVSPGFWLRTEAFPALARDPARFQSDANKVAASGAFWQLVTTWNEWGEGTAVEPADEFGSTYLDILAEAFDAGSTAPTSLPPPGSSVTFTASGDIGASSTSAGTLQLVADVAPDAHFVVGDFSYSQVTPESAWCSFVKNIVGSSLPFELLTGNHEDDKGSDGFVRKFTECLPDRLGVVGDYGVQYYADLGGLVRVIAIAADLEVDGTKYRYTPGSPERAWLESAVLDARADGKWVVVMHHKVCISSAEKACSVGEELANWEAANVDVVVMGHSHTYQRTHQLSCVDADTVTQSCIADMDGTHNQGDGAVFVINGLGGDDRPVNRADDEYGYFAALLGQGDAQEGHGIVRFIVSPTELTGTFIGSDTSYTDTFTIFGVTTGRFSDTSNSTFDSDIAWLADQGITKGCNPPLNTEFCPDSAVTRGQMAALLVRALGLTERLDNPFTDDDDSIFEADIERLAAAGITKGCNPSEGNTKFCPDGKVTREQMAAFLVRALGYTDPGAGDLFVDDDASIFEADIDRLATAGVTKGCNPPTNDRFCPTGYVTRGQMAACLHRALG